MYMYTTPSHPLPPRHIRDEGYSCLPCREENLSPSPPVQEWLSRREVCLPSLLVRDCSHHTLIPHQPTGPKITTFPPPHTYTHLALFCCRENHIQYLTRSFPPYIVLLLGKCVYNVTYVYSAERITQRVSKRSIL
jgi:hypothetical protein